VTEAAVGKAAARLEFGTTWQDCRDAVEEYYRRSWTDGLPVIPPTDDEVAAMVAASGRDALEAVGEVPPRRGMATVETVATCAVMAGCRPEYMPVVLTAIEALVEPSFNLNGIQSTGNGATPLCVVSGPIVDRLEMNYGTNLFGYGFRSNATIGRAIRLVLLIQGGSYPDLGTKSAMGSPARYTFCIAEAPPAPGQPLHNPWGPVHEAVGLSGAADAVTVLGANAPVNVWAGGGNYERDVFLRALAEEIAKLAMLNARTQLALVINPYAAQRLSEDPGWDRRTFECEIFERALEIRNGLAQVLQYGGQEGWLPGPESLVTIVAGGGHFPTVCALLSGWFMGGCWATTREIPSAARR
jgi:hypothetical protein